MSDFSLAPVDDQPDFADVSFVPIDHDPFSADAMIHQTGTGLESQLQSVAGSALDLIDAMHRDDLPGDIAAAAGMTPGARGGGAR